MSCSCGRIALVIFLSLSQLAAQPAQENKQVRAVLLTLSQTDKPEAWIQAEQSIRAEFSALGIQLLISPSKSETNDQIRVELEQAARAQQATCAIRISRTPGTNEGVLEILFLDRQGQKALYRQLRLEKIGGPAEAAAVAALKTVEVHRAGLIQVRFDERWQSEAQIEKTSLPPSPGARDSRWGLALGPSLSGSLGLDGWLFGIALVARMNWSKQLSLALDATISLSGIEIRNGADVASFHVALIRFWGNWDLLTKGFIRPRLGLGLGGAIPWTRGLNSQDLETKTDTTISAYLGADFGIDLVFNPTLWLRFSSKAGILLPELTILFGPDQVARFGRPVVETSLVFELRLP